MVLATSYNGTYIRTVCPDLDIQRYDVGNGNSQLDNQEKRALPN